MKLSIENLSFSYIDGGKVKKILDSINVEFTESKFYCITGPSGCGKTTLLSLMGTLDKPQKGSILLNGHNVNDDEYKYRRDEVGFVFQNYNLINYLTGYENVELARKIANKKIIKNDIYNMLQLVGIDKETANRKAIKLSGGEQQRVAIARALINDPSIILADEPTGNLDSETSKIIVEVFIKLAHEYNKCVIMVTHNPDISKLADIEYMIIDKDIKQK